MAAVPAFSAIRRGSRTSGKKVPWHSLGSLGSTLQVAVAAVHPSDIFSSYPAPQRPLTSRSLSCCAMNCTIWRNTSLTAIFSANLASAIVVWSSWILSKIRVVFRTTSLPGVTMDALGRIPAARQAATGFHLRAPPFASCGAPLVSHHFLRHQLRQRGARERNSSGRRRWWGYLAQIQALEPNDSKRPNRSHDQRLLVICTSQLSLNLKQLFS